MTLNILTAAGEELYAKILDGTIATSIDSVTVGLYNDATDTITDADTDPATAITTELQAADYPGYSRQTVEVAAAETAPDQWGLESVNPESFTLDGSASNNVDGLFVLYNFTSEEGGGTADYIIGTMGLGGTHDAGAIPGIDFAAGEIELNFED